MLYNYYILTNGDTFVRTGGNRDRGGHMRKESLGGHHPLHPLKGEGDNNTTTYPPDYRYIIPYILLVVYIPKGIERVLYISKGIEERYLYIPKGIDDPHPPPLETR